ncbi:RNA polymerase sigma factor [Novipirellula aureliae]|uniref:RNA polymerase sigma factor n=1 Tax=Novipirellula aureliae TaxID=2527966 RepID=A0A5C6DYJ9_9BACT|nr:RNA polymerase sigma factor [Novipirellula aureliae]TWU40126.1 RNA polymerase sigma factor [Novipirellula aureliae]
MNDHGTRIDDLYRNQSRKVFASLVRLLRDFDLAEEAMQEAFASAIIQWEADGVPANPMAWLISAGRFKAVDIIRRREKARDIAPEVTKRIEQVCEANVQRAATEIEDDQLRLIFTCCHPAIDPKVQVPLTLREVCGLTTEEIAKAFLTSPTTMAQRIVRGKAKIRDAGIPFVIPALSDLPERLDGVLSVIYLIFNEGYSASNGDSLVRCELSDEAIRLCRLLLELHNDAEVMGLLGLMLLHESRRTARATGDGQIVLLEDQDRSMWNRDLIVEGKRLVERSLTSRQFGFYTLQAAISAAHANAITAADTDWNQIVALYSVLIQVDPSPVVELNRAVAVAMRDGPDAGITLIDAILERGELANYHLTHSARGELLRRAGRTAEAVTAFEQSLALTQQQPERRFLTERLRKLRES